MNNLTNTSFTEALHSLLANGPNFAVAPNNPPNSQYIVTAEQYAPSQNQVKQVKWSQKWVEF